MISRLLTPPKVLPGVLAVVYLGIAVYGSQAPPAGRTAPRTVDGRPDLQGEWNYSAVTPLERPSELKDKQILTDEEASDFERRIVGGRDPDGRSQNPQADVSTAYNAFWYEQGMKLTTKRTSLIVDPPDGRIPPLTPEAKKRADAVSALSRRRPAGPEDMGVVPRCILGFNAGPPMLPRAYNNNVQLLQTRDYFAILNEMVHTPRIVPLDGRPHVSIPQWVGDSRGSWKGDTLIVDTTYFRGESGLRDLVATPNLRLVERFRRVSADTLIYQFTVEDPTTYTRPWTVEFPMTNMAKSHEHLYEYACHEGNRAMVNILTAARGEEKANKDAATKRPQ